MVLDESLKNIYKLLFTNFYNKLASSLKVIDQYLRKKPPVKVIKVLATKFYRLMFGWEMILIKWFDSEQFSWFAIKRIGSEKNKAKLFLRIF